MIGCGLGYSVGSLLFLALGRGDMHLLVMGLLAMTVGLLVPRQR